MPGTSGRVACHVVTDGHLTGHGTPLIQMVLTPRGAVPDRIARLLLTVTRLAVNLRLATPWFVKVASSELCIVPIHPSSATFGFATRMPYEVVVNPLAAKMAYFASSSGFASALFIARFAMSCKARR